MCIYKNMKIGYLSCTYIFLEPNVPTMLNANVSIEVTKFVIGVSWQVRMNNY